VLAVLRFCFSRSATAVGRLEVHKKLGGNTARAADLSWPKGYYIPYHTILSNKSGEKGGGRGNIQSHGVVFLSSCYVC